MTDSEAKTLAMQAMGRMYGFTKGKFMKRKSWVRRAVIGGTPFVIICDPNLTARGTIVE